MSPSFTGGEYERLPRARLHQRTSVSRKVRSQSGRGLTALQNLAASARPRTGRSVLECGQSAAFDYTSRECYFLGPSSRFLKSSHAMLFPRRLSSMSFQNLGLAPRAICSASSVTAKGTAQKLRCSRSLSMAEFLLDFESRLLQRDVQFLQNFSGYSLSLPKN